MMDLLTFYTLLEKYGTFPILIGIIFVLVWIIKRLDANSRSDKYRNDEIKRSISDSIKETEGQIEKTLDDHGCRLKVLEMESLSKADFQREIGGWRTDLSRLADRIDAQGGEFRQLIIDLWKEKSLEK